MFPVDIIHGIPYFEIRQLVWSSDCWHFIIIIIAEQDSISD